MQNDHRQLAKGVGVNLLGMIAKSSRPLFLIIFSRFLGAEKFGVYMLAFATYEIVSKMSGLGLDMGIKRLVGRLKAHGREQDVRTVVMKTLLVALCSSAVVALGLSFCAEWISHLILGSSTLVSPLKNFCWGMPALCGTTLLLYAIRPTLRMQYELYVRSILEPVLILGLGFIALRSGLDVPGLAIAHNIAAFFSLLAALFFFLRLFPRAIKPVSQVDWRLLWSTGIPMGSTELLAQFKNRLDLMVIGYFMPLASVGIYSAVLEVTSALRKLRATFDPIVMPMAQTHHETDDRLRLNNNLELAIRWVMIPSFAMFGTLLLVPEAYLMFFGSQFEVGAHALRILALGQLVTVTIGLVEGVLAMVGFAYITLINSAVMILLNLVLLRLLVPQWGLVGAAWATCTSFIVVAVWRLEQAHRLAGIFPFGRSQLKPIVGFTVALLCCGASLYWWKPTHFWMQLLLAMTYVAIYGFINLTLGVDGHDKDILKQVRNRLPKIQRLIKRNKKTPELKKDVAH